MSGRRHRGADELLLFPIVLLFLGSICGCSVKEDRSPCPSLLIVDTDRLTDALSPHTIHVWGDGPYHCFEKMVPVDYSDRDWRQRGQKGFNVLSCTKGLDRSALEGTIIRIPTGE